jgi:hypothetical protein
MLIINIYNYFNYCGYFFNTLKTTPVTLLNSRLYNVTVLAATLLLYNYVYIAYFPPSSLLLSVALKSSNKGTSLQDQE